jgi:excinuclease UvrABC ATPase subunit
VDLFDINNFLGGEVTWYKLSEIADLIRGTYLDRNSRREGDTPVLRISDLSNQKPSVDELQKITPPEDKKRIQYAKTGDILVPRVGSTIRASIVNETLNGVMVDQNLYIVRLAMEYQHFRGYIVEFLRSDKGQGLISKNIMGAMMPQLRFSDLANMRIPVPSETVIKLLATLQSVETKLFDRIEVAQNLRSELFNIDNPDTVYSKLEELSTNAQVLSSSLVQRSTPSSGKPATPSAAPWTRPSTRTTSW